MVATYVRPLPVMVKGEGCYLWDIENRRYLDFMAGIAVNALGHCDPEMAKLMAQQVDHLYATTLTSNLHKIGPDTDTCF
jgi:acetylornithine aminotransferase